MATGWSAMAIQFIRFTLKYLYELTIGGSLEYPDTVGSLHDLWLLGKIGLSSWPQKGHGLRRSPQWSSVSSQDSI